MHKTFFKFSLLLSTPLLLNAETINIVIPAVPKVTAKVPKAVELNVTTAGQHKTNDEILKEVTQERVIHFSNHVAPVHIEKKDDAKKIIQVGDIKNGMVPAYLHAPLLTPTKVQSILEGAGFKVVKIFKVDKKGIVNSVIFTNDAIIKMASQKGHGFAANLHVTIDKKDSLISITNPLFYMAAFMQDKYDKKVAEATLASLRDAFKNLKNSKEESKFRMLKEYQFMAGMPKYVDMQIVKKLSSSALLQKARKSKKIVYEQKLSNGATLIGVKLSKRTSRFIKKTGYENAGLLPYPVLIEDGEAKILDPKYYISVMYPMLKMGQFMTIATVPGAINKDIDKVFR